MNPCFAQSLKRSFHLAMVVAALLAVLSSETASAVELRVDIGVTDVPDVPSVSPNDVLAGFEAFNVDPDGNQLDQTFRPPGVAVTHVLSGVTISVVGEGGNGAFYMDHRTDVSGPWGDLAEDGVMMFETDLIVTVSGLPAGLYDATLFHHWASDPNVFPPFDVYLGVGGGETLAAADVAFTSGYDPASIAISAFQILADGGDIVFRLDGELSPSGLSTRVYLNGFTIVPVPEPSSWLLLGLGAIVLGGARQRRRRLS